MEKIELKRENSMLKLLNEFDKRESIHKKKISFDNKYQPHIGSKTFTPKFNWRLHWDVFTTQEYKLELAKWAGSRTRSDPVCTVVPLFSHQTVEFSSVSQNRVSCPPRVML